MNCRGLSKPVTHGNEYNELLTAIRNINENPIRIRCRGCCMMLQLRVTTSAGMASAVPIICHALNVMTTATVAAKITPGMCVVGMRSARKRAAQMAVCAQRGKNACNERVNVCVVM